jgi:hypothetical protein
MKPRKVIDLPSDHWFELTECWACHHEDYTTLPGQVGGMIFAQKDILMVGKSYYMLHRDNVSHLELRITGKEVSSNLDF